MMKLIIGRRGNHRLLSRFQSHGSLCHSWRDKNGIGAELRNRLPARLRLPERVGGCSSSSSTISGKNLPEVGQSLQDQRCFGSRQDTSSTLRGDEHRDSCHLQCQVFITFLFYWNNCTLITLTARYFRECLQCLYMLPLFPWAC